MKIKEQQDIFLGVAMASERGWCHAARWIKGNNEKVENWKVMHPLNSYHILMKASVSPLVFP